MKNSLAPSKIFNGDFSIIAMDLYFHVMEFPILFKNFFLLSPFLLLLRQWRLGIVGIQKRNRFGSPRKGNLYLLFNLL